MKCEVLCMRKCYILYIKFWFVMFDLYMLFFSVNFSTCLYVYVYVYVFSKAFSQLMWMLCVM